MLGLNIYSHRGVFDNSCVIENTIEAFKEASYLKYNIELDIRITKDNKIVVFHDEDLRRMTNNRYNFKIRNLLYKDILDIKLLNSNSCIPLLSDVLKVISKDNILLIELKDNLKKEQLIELDKILLNYNGVVYLQTFNPFLLKKIASLSLNRYRKGILLTDKYKGFRGFCYNVYMYNYFIKSKYCNFLSSPKVLAKKIKDRSKKELFIYTIKTKKEFILYKKISNNLICNKF